MSGGSVHGLVCLIYYKQIPKGRKETVPVICNPSTGQSLTLPKVRTNRVNVISYLGYDPVGKQFKVLSMSLPIFGNQKGMCGEHQVLTLGPGKLSWRMINCSAVPHGILYNENRICINGVLYYQAWVLGFSKVIICFDVSSEKFTLINLDKDMVPWHEPTLVNYKGKLGALTASDFGSFGTVSGDTECLQLWVLVDAEKHEWLKYTYVLPPLWKNVVGNASLDFVILTGTNEIVLSSDDPSGPFCVFYYNFERQTVRKVVMQGMDTCVTNVHTFVDHVEDVKLMKMFLPRVS
ncbi:PREDICTED: F-box protein DOR-like [Camelina sativa]|uniref:F-box protein DOR-like n=1 Tax=Camelina sativa TaxID=90675 RepID=A0ABM1RP63_CAMSA|nr:PREDICTED: F-box protein DOR-like [Camelina sativa]